VRESLESRQRAAREPPESRQRAVREPLEFSARTSASSWRLQPSSALCASCSMRAVEVAVAAEEASAAAEGGEAAAEEMVEEAGVSAGRRGRWSGGGGGAAGAGAAGAGAGAGAGTGTGARDTCKLCALSALCPASSAVRRRRSPASWWPCSASCACRFLTSTWALRASEGGARMQRANRSRPHFRNLPCSVLVIYAACRLADTLPRWHAVTLHSTPTSPPRVQLHLSCKRRSRSRSMTSPAMTVRTLAAAARAVRYGRARARAHGPPHKDVAGEHCAPKWLPAGGGWCSVLQWCVRMGGGEGLAPSGR
jgi:hypothetical protein